MPQPVPRSAGELFGGDRALETMLIVARRHSVRRGLADRLGTEHQSGGPLCSPREYALRELPHGVKGEGEM
jgi:hypothetical protein